MSNQSFTINPGITKIDHPSAYALIQSGQCLLIDVREKDEYDSGFIPTAVNLSVNNITKETASAIAPDKAKPIIVYCRSGRRTIDASKQLNALGYYYVLDMGGISNWPYEIEYPKSK
ncbi:MAG: rhodanese-like domain-containing protein [Succinivibrio sp.]|nr:rhodanese-like domain-containing protein [Succinivibrio sp.]